MDPQPKYKVSPATLLLGWKGNIISLVQETDEREEQHKQITFAMHLLYFSARRFKEEKHCGGYPAPVHNSLPTPQLGLIKTLQQEV